MIRSLPSLKVIVLFICLYYKLVSFRGLYKLRPRPDWSLLGVKFKISDEHPRPFYMGVPPPGALLYRLVKQFLWYFASMATKSPKGSFAISLLSFRRLAQSRTFFVISRVEAQCKFSGVSSSSQKKHCCLYSDWVCTAVMSNDVMKNLPRLIRNLSNYERAAFVD